MINDQLPYVKTGDPIKAEHINAIVKALKLRTPRPSDTVSVRQTANGFVMDAASGGGANNAFRGCWCPTFRKVGETLKVDFTQGYLTDGVSTVTPTVTDITCPTATDTLYYAYLAVNFTPTEVDGYVTGGTIGSVSVIIDTSIPSNTNSTGYILLCTIRNGAVVDRHSFWSLGINLLAKDSSSGVYFRYYAAS